MNKTFEQWQDHVIKMKMVLAIDFDRIVEDWREEREIYKREMTNEYLRVVLKEIKDDLLRWNNGNEFDEWSDVTKRISLVLKQLNTES